MKTPVGKMLDYYLKMEPHLLHAAIEKQLETLKEEKDRIDEEARDVSGSNKSELVLYRCKFAFSSKSGCICQCDVKL